MPIKQKDSKEKVIKKKAVSVVLKTKSKTAKKKTVKKTVLHKKKQVEQSTATKIVKKRKDKIIKSIPKKKELVKIKEAKEAVVKQNWDTEGQNKKNDSVDNNVKVESSSKYEQKSDEQKVPISVKTKKVKLEIVNTEYAKFKDIILINELITVRELADKMRLRSGDVLKKLLSMGSLATINQRLDADTATLLANEFGYDVKIEAIYLEDEVGVADQCEDSSKLKPRSPIVTIMGHVDHGKTSLLDAIRSSNITGGEYGGITQHIGAYKVQASCGGYITFLDTPGHKAFTAMRLRGSQATDIIVLVVSATDGVMPQTVESINHAKAANVPIIVAVSKVDMPVADPHRIRQELSNYGLIPEEWGGDTIMVDISAKQKTNINLLLEMILLKAEMMELKANPDRNAEGIVIEAALDSRKGTIATLLIQTGTLKIGDNIVVGTACGKVRALTDENGKRVAFAEPSASVSVLGINEIPQAGDKFVVVKHESKAREIAQSRREKVKEASLKPVHHLSLADISAGKTKDLRIILKADAQGSLGALSDALERLSTSEISLKIIHSGAGAITESDVALAVASDALIVGFSLRPDSIVERLAETEKVSINVYRIIYDLIADVKSAMEGLLDPGMKEKILGKAVVKQVFKISSFGTISGCSVMDGKIQRGSKVRLLRDNVIVFEGNIFSLKRFKDDVKEAEKGYECGIGLENFSDVKPGDVMESFITKKVARKLEN